MTKRRTPELKILGVQHAGDITMENLVLVAQADIANIDDFMVMDLTFAPQAGKSNLHPHSYRFPAKKQSERKVKKGDLVILFTCLGSDSASPNDDPEQWWAHFYHMKLKSPIWNQSGDTATVLYCEEVDSKTV